MDVSSILAQLRAERNRLDQAIAALEAITARGAQRPAYVATLRRQHRFSAATRKRMSEMMKKRWATRKKAGKSKL